MELTLIQKIVIWALPVIFAITLHEVAHGWVANWFGDKTAKLSGRLTLNPVKHVDLVGTIILPIVMLMVSNFIFGWAKPVPVDQRNLGHPRRDMVFVAAAGPIANILMALFWACVARLGILAVDNGNSWAGIPFAYMGNAGIIINVVLAVLNLIPLPPLDGGRLVANLLPPRLSWQYSKIEPYGFIILLLLIFTGGLSYIMGPAVFFLINHISSLFGLGG